jgi:hypothetical protein
MGMEILLIGALITGLPLMIACLISYLRERQYNEQAR